MPPRLHVLLNVLKLDRPKCNNGAPGIHSRGLLSDNGTSLVFLARAR